jgi:uncharacterized protein DUF3500
MAPAQRQLLDALLDEVTGDLPPELADRERARVAASAPDNVVFTWAGGASVGQPHYYRVAGPSFLYELDNTQAGANHVHTVWHVRAPADGDFAVDLLRQHYAEAHAAADTPATRKWRAELGRPIEPFRIVGNIYYVGASNIASYLIATRLRSRSPAPAAAGAQRSPGHRNCQRGGVHVAHTRLGGRVQICQENHDGLGEG